MKRPESNRFIEFSKISPYFKYSIGLTASPASNGLINVWGQMFVLDNGQRLGTNYAEFKHNYFSHSGGKYAKYEPKDETRQWIANAIQDISIQMSSDDYLDMPKVVRLYREIKLPVKIMKEYERLEKDFYMELGDGNLLEVGNAVAVANKLRQLAGGIVYEQDDPEDISTRVSHKIHNKKFIELESYLNELQDEPCFLLYEFTSEKEEIMKRHPHAVCLTGVDHEEAVLIMGRFNAGEIKLLISHPLSTAYGLNFQKRCCHVCWFDIPWNLELYLQAIGRIARQGQTRPVFVTHIIASDTIENKVVKALAHKEKEENSFKEEVYKLTKK